MSYPEPTYFGDTGEVSAVYRPADHEPELVYPSAGSVDYLAKGADTKSEFGLYRWNFGPGRTGPDPHFHKTISESFYILSGTVRLYDGNKWIDGTPGDFLFVPEGGIHGFRNESGEPASMLLLFAPGAPREEYFETLAEIAGGRVLSEEEKLEFYLRHDNYWI
ncbi:cupin domain-containing protein [Actinopolymorpha alba]|uniref:cupin domain-containing protein n=1 Tax=Actinopolymorpha alba TaxID=533267 RepID=UPI0003636430|nr:cupin domain-containing protein [Actinopolymorpha alba]